MKEDAEPETQQIQIKHDKQLILIRRVASAAIKNAREREGETE